MAKRRGKRAAKIARGAKVGPRAKTERDSEDIRRLRRAAGSWEKLHQWIKEEPSVVEDFDDALLPGLAEMEKYWKLQRSPEARRKARPAKLLTREEIIRAVVDAAFPNLSDESKDALVRRLKRKLRMYKPPN